MNDISSQDTFTVGGLQTQQPMDVSLQNHMKGQTEKYMDMGKNVWINKSMVVQFLGSCTPNKSYSV